MDEPSFKEVTKTEFREIYFRFGGEKDSGWTAEYWQEFFEDKANPGWKFMVREPESPNHDSMWIVSDSEAKEYRLFFMTEQGTDDFFDYASKD